MFSDIDNLRQLIIELDVANEEDIKGISIGEINIFESQNAVTFPKKYKKFLLSFGRSAGCLCTDRSFFFDDLKKNEELFSNLNKELLIKIELPSKFLIISSFKNTFDYIRYDVIEDNPAVYRIDIKSEVEAEVKKIAESFTEYLKELILKAECVDLSSSFFENENI